MFTVYLDSQLYRYLKNNSETDFRIKGLKDFLEENSNNFLVFYSHAHLLDLKEDKSDKKYDDLIYMQKWVDKNFLILYYKQNQTTYELIEPIQAFKNLMEEDDKVLQNFNFTDFFDLSKYSDILSEEQIENFKKQLEILNKTAFSFAEILPKDQSLSPEQLKLFNEFFPSNSNATFLEVLEKMASFMKKFQDDKDLYRNLRNVVNEGTKLTKLIDLSKYDQAKFLVDLADIKASDENKMKFIYENLLSQVNKSLMQMGNENPNQFDLHYHAYFSLDLYGIEQEKNKKLKTNSLLNDAHHSFYAAHCNIVVSDDYQFREKSKLLYNLFKLDIKVLSPEEFVKEKFQITSQTLITENDFFKNLLFDLENALIKEEYSPTANRHVTIYKSFINYFQYFNDLYVIREKNKTYWQLRHNEKTYSTYLPYKLIEQVTNKCVGIFRIDDFGIGVFNSETEIDEIKNNNWRGRVWERGNFEIILEIHKQKGYLHLVLHDKTK